MIAGYFRCSKARREATGLALIRVARSFGVEIDSLYFDTRLNPPVKSRYYTATGIMKLLRAQPTLVIAPIDDLADHDVFDSPIDIMLQLHVSIILISEGWLNEAK